MRTMDRHLFAAFLSAWIICFVSMVGLYAIIDLFSNADEFIEDHAGTVAFVRRASKYYGVHSFEYFGRLSPIITMIAAMVTLASLHRHNELVALLAAGIPTSRAIAPVLFGAGLMIGLGVLNREIVLPRYSDLLQRVHDNIEADSMQVPIMHFDEDQILFRAGGAHHEDRRLDDVSVTLPMEVVGQLQIVKAPRAYCRRDAETGRSGWLLEDPSPVQIVQGTTRVKLAPNDDLFIFSDVSFADMIRKRNWMTFASTGKLIDELSNGNLENPQSIRTTIHKRFMQPVLNALLVLIGVPFVLQWDNRNIYRSIAICMALCALFYVVDSVSSYFATYGYLDPMTAAWAPVFLFGPVALALFHRIGT